MNHEARIVPNWRIVDDHDLRLKACCAQWLCAPLAISAWQTKVKKNTAMWAMGEVHQCGTRCQATLSLSSMSLLKKDFLFLLLQYFNVDMFSSNRPWDLHSLPQGEVVRKSGGRSRVY